MVAGAGGLSRRRLIAGAGAGAAGVLATALSGCGGNSKGKEASNLYGQASEERVADAAMLDAAVEIELGLAAAYEAIARRLTGSSRALVHRIAAQEHAHFQSLSKAIEGLATVPTYAPAAPVAAPRSVADALQLAIRKENEAIAFYIDALPKLSSDNKLRSPVAAIMANEAEHLLLLQRALGIAALPQPFVQGRA